MGYLGRRRVLRAIGLGSVTTLVGMGGVAASPASAATITCGQVITHNTTLTADVGPCRGNGLIIGANRITLDLGGHTVSGARTRRPSGDAAGIRLPARSHVTVRNGTITGFDAGVVVGGGAANTLTALTVQDNLSSANDDPAGSQNFTANLGDGIVIMSSPRNNVTSNVVRRNGVYDNIAVIGTGSDDNRIQSNVISAAVGAAPNNPPNMNNTVGQGIVINAAPLSQPDASLHRNTILSNVVENNVNSGIITVSNIDGIIQNNVVRRNGFSGNLSNPGINISAAPTLTHVTNVLVSNNVVTDNAEVGIRGSAIDSSPTSGNRILSNTVSRNASTGIDDALNSLIQDNLVTQNGFTGRFAGGGISMSWIGGNSVIDNRVIGNNKEGIAIVQNQNDIIRGNQVHRNSASGIALVFAQNNVVRDNDATDNMIHPGTSSFDFSPATTGADLLDINTNDFQHFDCDANVWLNNKWGSGGYFPSCVTAGGSGPPNPAVAAQSQSLVSPENGSTPKLPTRPAPAVPDRHPQA